MSCKPENPVNGKKSELYGELVTALGNEKEASDIYNKIVDRNNPSVNSFKSQFGDWQAVAEDLKSKKVKTLTSLEDLKEVKESESSKFANRLNDDFEPKLFKKNNQYFFKMANGEPMFLRKVRFPKLSTAQATEVTNQLTYNFLMKTKSTDYNDVNSLTQEQKETLWKNLPSAIEDFAKNHLVKHPEDKDKIDVVLEYKDDFADEIKDKIEEAGFKFMKPSLNEDGSPGDEMQEDEKDSGLNIQDNFETSTKDRAKANIKLILGQIPDVEEVKDFRGNTVLRVKQGDYLAGPKFVSIDEVWSTLEPLLADTIGYGNGDVNVDPFDLMLAKIKNLGQVKPWAKKVVTAIEGLNVDKKIQFVQAFNLVRLNFNVTEYDPTTFTYSQINATSTNSKASQVRSKWSNDFRNMFVGTKTIPADRAEVLLTWNEDAAKLIKDIEGLEYNLRTSGVELKHSPDDLAVGKHQKEIRALYSRIGIGLTANDLMTLKYLSNQDNSTLFKETTELLKRTRTAINDALQNENIMYNGTFQSPFDTQSSINLLAAAVGMNNTDISENTILLNSKQAWTYSTPSYIHNRVNTWKSDSEKVAELSRIEFNKNSRWASFLNAEDIDSLGKEMYSGDQKSMMQLDRTKGVQVELAGALKTKSKNDGVDIKSMTQGDAISENMEKMYDSKGATFSTIAAADKSKRFEIRGFELFDSKIDYTNGNYTIPDATADIGVKYFQDEYNRMSKVWASIEDPDSEKITHYNSGRMNGTKSQLFPSLSYDNLKKSNKNLYDILYDKDGKPLITGEFTGEQAKQLRFQMRRVFQEMMTNAEDNVVKNKVGNRMGDSFLMKNHGKLAFNKFDGKNDSHRALLGDYVFNGFISNVEYGKLFAGDPAYFKDTVDMIKRIPGTYTDGSQLNIKNAQEEILNIATVAGVEVSSRNYDIILQSLKDSGLTAKEAKSVASNYIKDKNNGGVNTTDAQAWITPNRWRFIMKRLGKWGPQHDNAYERMMAGDKLKKSQLKLVMQPLKGVYYGMDESGVPTYLKYSQAVLVPNMVKGTPMAGLLDKMTKDDEGNALQPHEEIHEVITIDGVKVGAKNVGKLNVEGSTEMLRGKDMELNPVQLSNRNWKLQQDLPTKLDKQVNLGSQIQKNLLEGIDFDKTDYNFKGKSISGKELYNEIVGTVDELSKMGMDRLKSKFKIDGNNKITNTEALYKELIKEFKGSNADENVIAALEKELPFDAIPQLGAKIESVFLSHFNKEIVKIQTNGGSYIQVSPFGMEEVTEESGIKIVSKNYNPKKGLLPPRIENGVMKPGQAFLPHSAIIKALPDHLDYTKMSGTELMQYIDPSALEMVTYRIPNQGMSSNDMLEIVGFLPEGMGDSIMGYDGIPAKTGSDFDIDKMFAMMPNFTLLNGKVVKSSSTGEDLESKQNKLFELYRAILLDKDNYAQMMRSIDSEFLKADITSISPKEDMVDGQLFSPLEQLSIKFEYMGGKFGVAQTANHLVDHNVNRSLDLQLSLPLGRGNVHPESGLPHMDRDKNESGSRKIGDVLSAFLNGYVDIAKDPFVTRGNHNDVTANTTFMLLRAGVDVEWINRFIASPILKEYVKTKKNNESIIEPVEGAVEYSIRKTYGLKEVTVTPEILADLTATKLETATLEDKDMMSKVLAVYKYYEEIGSKFNDSVGASKADTKGSTGSFSGMHASKNKIDRVLADGVVIGFDEKINNSGDIKTMTGSYTENALNWTSKVLDSSDLFLRSKEDFAKLAKNMADKQTGRIVTEEYYKNVAKGFNAYTNSKLPIFNNSEDNLKLFSELPGRLIAYGKKYPGNFLVSELDVKLTDNILWIKNNNKNKPKSYKNQMYRSWSNMLKSDHAPTKKLGEDLVRYAFQQSGFNYNINEFFSYIPHWYLMDKGISGSTKGNFGMLRDDKFQEEFFDQYVRHNASDKTVVQRITPSQISSPITEQRDPGNRRRVITLAPKKASKIAIEDSEGRVSYPKFISYDIGGGNIVLYRYLKQINMDSLQTPMYVRTFQLGGRSAGGQMQEYAYGKKKTQSVYPDNIFEQEFIKAQKATINLYDERFPSPVEELNDERSQDIAQEQRILEGEELTVDQVNEQVEYMQERMNVEVIIDSDVSTSRVLPSSDERVMKAGKPVILFNPKKMFGDTVFHEFGHIFIDSAPKGVKNPRIKGAIEQLKGSELWAEVQATYPDLTLKDLEKEVLAQAIGREAQDIFSDREEQSKFQAFLNWFKDFIKRTFGIEQNEVKAMANEMLKQGVDTRTFQSDVIQEQRFVKTPEQIKARREAVSLDKTHRDLIGRLKTHYEDIKPRSKQARKDEEEKAGGRKTPSESAKEILNDIETNEKSRGILRYAIWSESLMVDIERDIKNEMQEKGYILSANSIQRYKKRLQPVGSLKSLKQLLFEMKGKGEFKGRTPAYDKMLKRLNTLISHEDTITEQLLNQARQRYAKAMVANSNKHLKEWEQKFAKDYRDTGHQGMSEQEYVIYKMAENKYEIQDAAIQEYLERSTEALTDVDTITGWLMTEKNINSDEIQVVSRMIDRADRAVDAYAQKVSLEIDAFNKELSERYGWNDTMSNFSKYQRFLDEEGMENEDKTGKKGWYFKSKYKREFIETKQRMQATANDVQLAEEVYKDYAYDKTGYTNAQGHKVKWGIGKAGLKEFKGDHMLKRNGTYSPVTTEIARMENTRWINANVVKNAFEGQIPTKKWLNPEYAKLNAQEQKDLSRLKDQIHLAEAEYDGRSSLVEKSGTATWVRLPGVLKTSTDRLLQDKGKGFLADLKADALKVREDEMHEYDEDAVEAPDSKYFTRAKTDVNNRIKHDVPIPFRAKLNKSDQSFDVATMLLLNRVHSKNYSVKKPLNDTVNIFLDVMITRDSPEHVGMEMKTMLKNFDVQGAYMKVFKSKDKEKNDVKKLFEMQEHRIFGVKHAGSATAHKKVGALLKYSGKTSLLLNTAAETVNLLTGTVNNFLEGVGGEVYNLKDMKNAEKSYWGDLKGIMDDMGKNVQTSRTSQLNNQFNTFGDRNYLNNNFEESTRARSLSKINNLRFIAQAGEHMMQSKIMYAILHSQKVINAQGQYLDKNGKVTKDKANAASMNDVIYFEKGEMKLPEWVKYNTRSKYTSGKVSERHDQIFDDLRSIIKKKVIDAHGLYDGDIPNAMQRTFWGKAIFFLRKWMMPTGNRRWKGVVTVWRKKENMREGIDTFYSEDLGDYQEGYHVTALRFIREILPAAFREGGIQSVMGNLNDMEKANLRKSLTELSAIVLVSLLYAAMGEDAEDDYWGLRARYILRREIAELAFYISPMETYRIAATPSAAQGTIEKALRLFDQSFDPLARYEQGYNKGRSKWGKKAIDMLPGFGQLQRDYDSSLKFLQW